jgi:4-amino-4-deoxy-L-arabinose transferase-like glycosyltransferase
MIQLPASNKKMMQSVMRRNRMKWNLGRVLLCSAVVVTLFLGMRGLYETTEGRYAECARQMMVAGDWLRPILNGNPHWTKPPVTYICIIATMRTFGVSTWTARGYLIPFFLLGVFGVWLLALHVTRDREVADFSSLVFAASIAPLGASTVVSTDLPLTAFLILSQAFFWKAVRDSRGLSVYVSWLLLALAFLTKGPPALLVVPPMVVLWRMLPQEQRQAIRFFRPGAVGIFLIVGVSWYVWEAMCNPGLLDYWIMDEVVNRSITDKFGRSPQFYMNFKIYLPLIVFGTWPWGSWLAVVRGRSWWQTVRWWLGDRSYREAHGWLELKAWSKRFPAESWWLLWAVAFPLTVFFLSRSKQPLYVLPLFGPLSLAVACALWRYNRQNRTRLWRIATVLACAAWVIFIGVQVGMSVVGTRRDMKILYEACRKKLPEMSASQMCVLNTKPLNGLQFYFESELPWFQLYDTEGIRAWATSEAGQDLYVVCQTCESEALGKKLEPLHAQMVPLTDYWCVLRIPTTRAHGQKGSRSLSMQDCYRHSGSGPFGKTI